MNNKAHILKKLSKSWRAAATWQGRACVTTIQRRHHNICVCVWPATSYNNMMLVTLIVI